MWNRVLEIILTTDDALLHLVQEYGLLTYMILFVIVYAETGLLFFPFLPGDGLLFSIGVVSGLGHLDPYVLILLIITAAYLGNMTSYSFGRYSARYFTYVRSPRWQSRMESAHNFYRDYGGNAVLLARFFPILRTYVPFVAGVAAMEISTFSKNSLLGAALWVLVFLLAGYFLGEIPWVQNNYGLIFLSLIVLTLMPFPIQYLRNKWKKR
ncbi:MAG: VTT domain-containing protein [Saprospiraceae bacterium]|nr:VTT domain-containing protein [Saprospiraceae bacterium]